MKRSTKQLLLFIAAVLLIVIAFLPFTRNLVGNGLSTVGLSGPAKYAKSA